MKCVWLLVFWNTCFCGGIFPYFGAVLRLVLHYQSENASRRCCIFPSEWHCGVRSFHFQQHFLLPIHQVLYPLIVSHSPSHSCQLLYILTYVLCSQVCFCPEMPFLVWNCCRSQVEWEQDWHHANTHRKFSVFFIKPRMWSRPITFSEKQSRPPPWNFPLEHQSYWLLIKPFSANA